MIVLSYPSHHLFAADVAAGRPSKVDGENDLVIGPYVQSQAFLFALLAIRSLQTRLVTSRKDGTPYNNRGCQLWKSVQIFFTQRTGSCFVSTNQKLAQLTPQEVNSNEGYALFCSIAKHSLSHLF